MEEHSRKFVEYLKKEVKPRSTVLLEKPEKEKKLLSENAEKWLKQIARKPYISIIERTRESAMTNYMANKVARELEIKGYARKMTLHTGKQCHSVVLMELTQKGTDFLGVRRREGRGEGSRKPQASVLAEQGQGPLRKKRGERRSSNRTSRERTQTFS